MSEWVGGQCQREAGCLPAHPLIGPPLLFWATSFSAQLGRWVGAVLEPLCPKGENGEWEAALLPMACH